MATVRLADAIIPEVYLSYRAVDNVETNAFVQAGIAVTNETLSSAFNGGGKLVTIPFWKDLDPDIEPNYSSDDPDVKSVPNKIGSGEQVARTAFLNQSYSAMNLVAELAGSNPMQRIRNRFGAYWSGAFQRRILAICTGMYNENVASHGSDMVVDISIADGANATDANVFSRSAFINAAFTMGDRFNSIRTIAVHSIVAKRMVDNDDIVFIPDSQGALTIPTFLGKRIVIDDMMPVVAGGTSGFVYTSIMFAEGAIGYGEGSPLKPVATESDEAAGNGAGDETIWERKTWIIHPLGYKWNEATVTAPGLSPTLANLRLAANWTRVLDRKLVPVSFLRTNG